MRLHITGATGFIGRHLLARARASGHEAIALVRSRTDELDGTGQIEIGDMAERADWTEAVAGADAVIHLAARVHMMGESGADLDATYERYNTAPTLALARAAADAGVRRFVFASSIKVNGERTSAEPFAASSEPAPVDPYGRSKHRAEQGLVALAAEGLSIAIVRPTVVYGPDAGGNIDRIARAVKRRVPLPLGAVKGRRSMVAVENLVTGLIAAAETEIEGVQTFLLADPGPVSARTLVERIAAGGEVKPRLVPVPAGLLRFGGRLLGRGDDIARLVDDLVVVPDWGRLGIPEESLVPAEEAMAALGRARRYD